MSSLAIIPARGGSTRLKGKNVYPINGKPLISYTIEAVIESKSFDKIIVSTDGEDIKNVASKYEQVEIIDRPQEFAGERVTVLTAIIDLLKHMDKKYDKLAYFLPTCPFRNASDIEKGMNLLTEDVDSVISTTHYDEPPQLMMIEGHNGYCYPVMDNLTAGLTNSKFIQKYVKPNGGYYMTWWDQLMETESFFIGNIKHVVLPKERSVDIDTIADVHYAESILGNQ